MKCEFSLALILLIIMSMLFSACTGASAPGVGNCRAGICVRMNLSGPVRLNEPVKVTITVESEKDEDGLIVSIGSTHRYAAVVEGQRSWTTNIKGRQPIQATTLIHFTAEGVFGIIGGVVTRQGLSVDDFVTVHVTRAGATIYPPGTRIPITPGSLPIVTVTRGPFPTLLKPTPTSPRPLTPTRPPYP